MINLKEGIVLLTAALVLGYIIGFPSFSFATWIISSLLALLILTFNTAGKKIAAYFYGSDAEISHWHITTYGFWTSMYFKKPFPMWIFAPLVLAFATLGYVKWLAITTFEAAPTVLRTRRKFANISEWDLALIAIAGIFANILLAFFGRIFGFNDFAMFNLWFALFNLIPISNLDGSKIFFGSRFLWIFSIIFLIALMILFDIAGLLATLVLALLIASIGLGIYYYLVEA